MASDSVQRLLPKNQELALEHALQGMTNAEIADRLGVSRMTVWQWSKSTGWEQACAQAQAERRKAAAMTITREMGKSLRVIAKLRDDDTQPGSVRLQAATRFLEAAGVIGRGAHGQVEAVPEVIAHVEANPDEALAELTAIIADAARAKAPA